ncbi:uncharacterized protein LOC120163004 [Hibiscus syriacus]|uniref:uncharacterized protein LOC120163004 n=1 Tax=Hibiscus syriacus TaxID=106335 RepID=UPI0019204F5C|nr:uncharacterized protein LOC120163004 [Hibiscus syriacus]
MGNCFTSNKIVSEQDDPQSRINEANEAIKETGNSTISNMEGAAEGSDGVNMKMKKVVRFKLNDDGSGEETESKNGAVRIRLVVTQEELKQIILSSGKDLKQPSMEQLTRVLKLRGARVSGDGRRSDGGEFLGGWRPALESIPEEH